MAIDVDVVVVGAGAAGLGAADAAVRKGASVALVERRRLGGECTWAGCVPSKALIERAREVWGGRRQGLTGEVDFPRIMAEVHAAMERIGQDESLPTLEAKGIRVLEGQATFTGPRQLSVDGTNVTARRAVILATGSAPAVPAVDGLEGSPYLTNDTVFELTALPTRLGVLGGGPIGLELAQTYQRLGSAVTLLQRGPRLAPKEEPEASEVLAAVLRAEGVDVRLGSELKGVSGTGPVTLHATGGDVEVDALLVAVGRQPVTDGLGLDVVGVERSEPGWIRVDDKLRTSVEGVLAIGDCTGGLQFTHVGYDQGAQAVANALGRRPGRWNDAVIPWATFTDPEIGRVGMTEQQAFEVHGARARVAHLPMADTDRGRATGKTEGFVKLIAGPKGPLGSLAGGSLLGATVVCPTGGDVVHEVAVLMRAGAFAGRLAQAVHAYPSWSMTVRECAAQLFLTYRGRDARPARGA